MLDIAIIAIGALAVFLGGRAYLREGRWARLGAILMPVGLAVAAVGTLLLIIPDFFGAK